jgi:hypothetical protein
MLYTTKTALSDVLIFNIDTHPLDKEQSGDYHLKLRLKGHTRESHGLPWNSSAADDHTIDAHIAEVNCAFISE